jgi:hypothetical protein
MYWQEKTDILKKKFRQSDFRDPFNDWPEVLKKIEEKFIVRTNSNYHFSNWRDNLKNRIYLRTIPRQGIYTELKKLNKDVNFWVVVTFGNDPTSNNWVYDCKIYSMEALLSIASGDFYIVEKKYKWMVFFEMDREKEEVALTKNGNSQTPFDNQSPIL